ncbi:MAG: hypothetical protein KDD67_13845 [Ignavibacteriae bacterium]|nr:hypothetical protein [Ignavibacteriota bacterium]MCB9216130.1 hypothetical protein [Ignavibacteria bacterium]
MSLKLEFVIPPEALREIGLRAAQMIRDHARAGLGADGQPLKPYSEKPFARPLGGITQKARKNLGDQLTIFTTRQGKLWAIIEGGYKAFKRAAYPKDGDEVNLTATGNMARSITLISVSPDGTLVIGASRAEEAEKLLYHSELGAGKSRVIRDVMGLSEKEVEELAQMAAARVRLQ